MKIAICGSMAFAKAMILVKDRLEKLGHSVILPEFVKKFIRYKKHQL